MSISNLSGSVTGNKPDIDVPELSYGINPRMPSASLAIDLRFSPDKGRFFVANQDLEPGKIKKKTREESTKSTKKIIPPMVLLFRVELNET